MATNYADVIQEQVPNTDTTAYTAPTVDSAHIISATVFNESAANATLIVNIVQSGGSAAVTNRYSSRTIPAGKPVVLHELVNMTLKTGDFISAVAGTASALNLKMTVKEITS